MKFESPQDYINQFEEKVENYITESFGTKSDFIEEEIEEINAQIEYIDWIGRNEGNLPEYRNEKLEKLISEVGIKRYRNACRRKLEFLENQIPNTFDLRPLIGKLKFNSKIDLVELAQALVSNGNWTGNRTELVNLLEYLSQIKIMRSDKVARKVLNRKEPHKFIAMLFKALDFESKK